MDSPNPTPIARSRPVAISPRSPARPLKSSNIVVGESSDTGSSAMRAGPDLDVLDFGLARITDTDVQASLVSEVGVIKGTLAPLSRRDK